MPRKYHRTAEPPIRAKSLLSRRDGIIHHRNGEHGQIVVAKQDHELLLLFCPLGVPLTNAALSGVMARMDLTAPSQLKGAYTKAMLASKALAPDPKSIYVLGAGGGCLVRALVKTCPDAVIHGSELDADVLAVTRQYFGLGSGRGVRISHAEGRAHLALQPDATFDHLYLDGYDAAGHVPDALSTLEFFDACAQKLSPNGIACVNLIETHPEYARKFTAFRAAFADVWEISTGGAHILFGRRAQADISRSSTDTLLSDIAAHVAHLDLAEPPRSVPAAPMAKADPLTDDDLRSSASGH